MIDSILGRFAWWKGLLGGVLVGLLLGWLWYSGDPLVPGRSVGNDELMRNVFRTDRQSGEPRVTDVTVYPPVPDPSGRPIYRVTFTKLDYDRDPETGNVSRVYERLYTDARTPFRPRRGRAETYTVIDWLGENADDLPGTWGEAWWKRPRLHYALFVGAGAILGGVVLPLTRRVLIARGMIEAPPPPEPKPKKVKAVKAPPPAPAPEPAPEPEPEQDRRKYGGVYYPVVKDEE